jgi:hypothetical protein
MMARRTQRFIESPGAFEFSEFASQLKITFPARARYRTRFDAQADRAAGLMIMSAVSELALPNKHLELREALIEVLW